MKRSPLKRKTPLRSRPSSSRKPRKRLLAKRATERRSSRKRDEAYLAWVRLQPCAIGASIQFLADQSAVRRHPDMRESLLADAGCSGPTDPDHKREGVGAGMKASDRDAWPCCRRHHDDRHALRGVFRNWSRDQLREFINNRIAEANARYERHLAQPEAA